MKKGITASTFDLLHAGHILMLKEAKSVCDYLIVALQVDPTIDRPEKNKPIQSYYERWVQVSAVKYVDEIIPYATEEELRTILQNYDIDIRILGDEYASVFVPGSGASHWDTEMLVFPHPNNQTENNQEKITSQWILLQRDWR